MTWPTVKLGEVCVVKRGTTITEKNASSGIFPVVAGGVTHSYTHNIANRKGNVITISGSGANAGYVNYWREPIFASDCSTVEVDNKNIDIKYVYFFLKIMQIFINSTMRSGAAQPHVYAKDIALMEMPLPPLAEQQRIVAILDKAEEIKRKREQAFRVTQSIIESLFAEILSKNISTTKYLSLDECLLKIIDYRGKTPIKTSSGVPLITARVVKNGELLEPTEFIASENYYNWMSRGMPEYGDVLFTTEAPLGEVAILDRTDVALAQRLVLLRPNPSLLNSLFLKYAMTCDIVVSDIHARSTGSTVKGIRQKELRLVKIPIIDIDQQNIFARKVEELLSLKATHKQSLQKSNLLFSSLQHQAFTTGFSA